MADTYAGMNRGQTRADVVIQASDPSTSLHLRLLSTSELTRVEVLNLAKTLAVQALTSYPPAADTFYAINRGQTRADVITDTSTTAAAHLELKVASASAITRHELHHLVRVLAEKLVFGTYPPA